MRQKIVRRICGILSCSAVILTVAFLLLLRGESDAVQEVPTLQGRPLRLCVRCEMIPRGTVLAAISERGVSTMAMVEDGEALFLLQPGRYRIGNAVFSFSKQAQPRAEQGPCRDDGELLYLTGPVLGSVTVCLERRPERTQFVYLAGENALRCLGIDGEDGDRGVFYALPMGSYQIYTTEGPRQTVALSLRTPDVTIQIPC